MKTEQAIKVTKGFIKEKGITDEDMIQDLYLMSIENAENFCEGRLRFELNHLFIRNLMQRERESVMICSLEVKEELSVEQIYEYLEKQELLNRLHKELDRLTTKNLIENLFGLEDKPIISAKKYAIDNSIDYQRVLRAKTKTLNLLRDVLQDF